MPWWTSCRFGLSIVCFFGTISLYMMRANMSVAIVCMTRDPDDSNDTAPGGSDWNYWHYKAMMNSPYADGSIPLYKSLEVGSESD